MIYKMFAVMDAKLSGFHRPWCAPSRGFAVRSFQDQCKDSSSELAKHPEDYSLWQIGGYDEDQGLLIPEKQERIALATDFVEAKA